MTLSIDRTVDQMLLTILRFKSVEVMAHGVACDFSRNLNEKRLKMVLPRPLNYKKC
jgi:hypothetical protein